MRKIILSLIILLCITSGCTESKEKSGWEDYENQKLMGNLTFIKQNTQCDIFQDQIEVITLNNIYLNDGRFYEYDINKKYSQSDNNCNFSEELSADRRYLYDQKTFELIDEKAINVWETENINYKKCANFLKDNNSSSKVLCLNNQSVVWDDKSIIVMETYENSKKIIEIDDKIKFVYEGNSVIFLKDIEDSRSSFYVIGSNNNYNCVPKLNDSCEYVDKECDYEYVCEKDVYYEKHKSNINYYDGIVLIDNNGNFYTLER